MKYSNLFFLTKANVKGNKNSRLIVILICLLVISIVLIPCFSVATVNAVNQYKEDYRARAMWLDPSFKPIDESALKAISQVEHVQSVDDMTGLPGYNTFNIFSIKDEDNKKCVINERFNDSENYVYIDGLIGNEKKSVIAGESLDNAPAFSCIVPHMFYPFEDEGNINYENLDYLDGNKLIGKTLTLNGDSVSLSYNYKMNDGEYSMRDAHVPSVEVKLKVVGVYYCYSTTYGSFRDVFVSRETSLQIIKECLEKGNIDLSANKSDLAKWWNDPSIHTYYVVVDNQDNIPAVFNEVNKMGYSIIDVPEFIINDSTIIISNLFSTVGTTVIFIIGAFAIFVLLQSTINSFNERRGTIGLMKAIGFRNRDVFNCLCWEQLYQSIKGFLIGGAFSALFIVVTNYIFSHKSYIEMIYIIDWKLFLVFLCIAFAMATIIPIICQLFLLRRLTKIQPREAMNSN